LQDKIDPYIKLSIEGCEDEYETEHKSNDPKPVWNQRFVFRLPVGSEATFVNLRLMDEDGMSCDNRKAAGIIPFPEPMRAFSGRVELDQYKTAEDAEPVVDCAIMYVPFEQLFKLPNVLDELTAKVEALTEDDAEDEAEKVRLQARLEALEADDAADEEQKAALQEKIGRMSAAAEAAAEANGALAEALAAAEEDDEEDAAMKAELAAQLEAVTAEKAAAQEAAANDRAEKDAAIETAKSALLESFTTQREAAEAAKEGGDIDALQEVLEGSRAQAEDLGQQLNAAQCRIAELEAELERKNPASATNAAAAEMMKFQFDMKIKMGHKNKKHGRGGFGGFPF
jgi:hypothetical protein